MRNFLAKQKLTTKIAMALSSLLVVVFAILIISVAVTTKTNIQKLSNEELTAISEKNAADVQSIFDLVDIVGSGAQDYNIAGIRESRQRRAEPVRGGILQSYIWRTVFTVQL